MAEEPKENGEAGCNRGRTESEREKPGDDAPVRYQFLAEWVRASYLNCGDGTGPFYGRLTAEEREEGKRLGTALIKHAKRFLETTAYLNENPEDPDRERLVELSEKRARKLGEIGDETATWAGRSVAELILEIEVGMQAANDD